MRRGLGFIYLFLYSSSFLKRDKAFCLSCEFVMQPETFSTEAEDRLRLFWFKQKAPPPPDILPSLIPPSLVPRPHVCLQHRRLSSLRFVSFAFACFLPLYYDRAPLRVGCTALRCMNGGFQMDDGCVGRASGVWVRVSVARPSRSGSKSVWVFSSIVLQVKE